MTNDTTTTIKTVEWDDIKPTGIFPLFSALKNVKKMTDEEIEKLREKMDAERKQEQAKEAQILSQKRYEQSGVPKKFYPHSIETYHAHTDFQRTVKAQVVAYIADAKNKMLLLYGNNGTGKTHLGCAVVRALGGRYRTSFNLCIEYEDGLNFHAKRTRSEILDFYTAQKVLVIDEIGRFSDAKTEKILIPALINMRYEDDLPTVIISNLSKKEIIEHFGKATYDRMTETCTAIDFQGESMRLQFRGSEAKGAD